MRESVLYSFVTAFCQINAESLLIHLLVVSTQEEGSFTPSKSINLNFSPTFFHFQATNLSSILRFHVQTIPSHNSNDVTLLERWFFPASIHKFTFNRNHFHQSQGLLPHLHSKNFSEIMFQQYFGSIIIGWWCFQPTCLLFSSPFTFLFINPSIMIILLSVNLLTSWLSMMKFYPCNERSSACRMLWQLWSVHVQVLVGVFCPAKRSGLVA